MDALGTQLRKAAWGSSRHSTYSDHFISPYLQARTQDQSYWTVQLHVATTRLVASVCHPLMLQEARQSHWSPQVLPLFATWKLLRRLSHWRGRRRSIVQPMV